MPASTRSVPKFPAGTLAGNDPHSRQYRGEPLLGIAILLEHGNYFQLLGATAELGRPLLADDDRTGVAPVVMLGHSFWKRHFASDSSVLGSQILIDGQWFTVVGVTHQVGGVSFENFPEIWIPLAYGVQIDPLLKSQIPLNHNHLLRSQLSAGSSPEFPRRRHRRKLDTLAERIGAANLIC